MTDAEKVEMLERENKLLKEQIELLKEIKSLKSKSIVGQITFPTNEQYWTHITTLADTNKC